MVFVSKTPHQIIPVRDTDGNKRNVCKCQLKDKHITEDEQVDFPVYECPEMTRKYGLGTESGF